MPTITLTVTLSGPDAEEAADRVAQAISEIDSEIGPAATLSAQPVLIDTPSRQVYVNGEPIRFTRREYDLLLFLTNHAGAAFTRLQLLRAVWGHEFSGERTVDVHVRRIRVKLRRHGDVLATVHGFGYRLESTDQIFVVQTR